MEAGAARRWRGGQHGGGVRLRDGGSRVAGDGACADSEALRALRLSELRDRPDRREDLDGRARTFAKASETVHAMVCARVSRFVRKGIAVHGAFGRWKNASGGCGIEGTDPPRACGIVLRLSRTVEGNSGELQPGKRIDGDEDSRADSNNRDRKSVV